MPSTLTIDFEVRSELDLEEVGLDLYSRHDSTEVLMMGYQFDHGKTYLWEPRLGPMPEKVRAALTDPSIIKIAWNAQFERVIAHRVLGIWIDYSQWRDAMVLSYSLSLPGKLEKVCAILKLAPEDCKDEAGKELMKFFCFPAPKKKKKVHTLFGIESRFHEPESFPEKWKQFCDYCLQDVHSEGVLWEKMNASPLPDSVWEEWFLDQTMNDIGMPCNRVMVENALWLAQEHKRRLVEQLVAMTGLANPCSDKQIKEWLVPHNYPWGSVKADYVRMELANPESKLTKEARAVLKLRLDAKKNSASKLETLLSLLGPDDRLRFQFQFMGAARTGRWAGRGVQPQNLPRPIKQVKKDYQRIIDLILARDYDTIEKEYGSVMSAVVSAIRMTFQAPAGQKMDVCDLNAIENRGLGYLARCPAILEVFKAKRCPYLSFAVFLSGRTYEELKAEYELYEATKGAQGSDQWRQWAKAPVLGGGYGLGGGDLYINEFGDEVRGGLFGYALNVCGVDMPQDQAHKAVKVLRDAWPEVPVFWKDLEEGFKRVFRKGGKCYIGKETCKKIDGKWQWVPCEYIVDGAVLEIDRVKMKSGGYMIRIKLPSGRRLHYLNVSVEREPFKYRDKKTGEWREAEGEVIYYDGIEHSATTAADGSRAKKKYVWGRVKTYGGKLCLGGATPVVTRRGLIPLRDIQISDTLWDGVDWVHSDGLVCNGTQETVTWMGLTGTPDHRIHDGNEWHELAKTTNRNGLCSLLTGLASAIRLWCSLNQENLAALGCDVTADRFLMSVPERYEETTSTPVRRAAVYGGREEKQKDLGTMSSWTKKSDNCGYENYQTSCLDAITPNAKPIVTTVDEELSVTSRGEKVAVFGWSTPSRCLDGITRLLTSIESTTTAITNREISGSSLEQRIQTIVEQLSGLSGWEKSFPTKFFVDDLLRCGARTLSTIISSADAPLNGVSTDTNKQKVYDIQNCGPRNRFTVMSDAGAIVVHNCENVVQAFCRDLLTYSIKLVVGLGFELFGCFHDELATLSDIFGDLGLADLRWCMSQSPPWAPDIPLGAAGFTSQFYRKG